MLHENLPPRKVAFLKRHYITFFQVSDKEANVCFSPHEFATLPCSCYNCRNSAIYFFVDGNPPILSTLTCSTRRGKIFYQALFYNIFHPETIRNGKLCAHGRDQAVPACPLTLTAWVKSGSFHVRFLGEKGARWQAFLRVLPASPISIITPLLHIHSFVNTQRYILRNVQRLYVARWKFSIPETRVLSGRSAASLGTNRVKIHMRSPSSEPIALW